MFKKILSFLIKPAKKRIKNRIIYESLKDTVIAGEGIAIYYDDLDQTIIIGKPLAK